MGLILRTEKVFFEYRKINKISNIFSERRYLRRIAGALDVIDNNIRARTLLIFYTIVSPVLNTVPGI